MQLNPKNIQDYVVKKVIEHIENRDGEIEALKSQMKKMERRINRMKRIMKEQGLCFECTCANCKRKIPEHDTQHSHNAHPNYETLCYRCFLLLL